MKTVTVNATKRYDVMIGSNILESCAKIINQTLNCGVAVIITDDVVDKLYSKTVEESFDKEGINYCKFVFKNGEKSKNIQVYSEILEFMASERITRSDTVIALGGGVVGDVAGFAAASYLRGIKFVQIPTTFLSAIDSSVGGKTAVNLVAGKNLVGAFYQPSLVLCDINTFNTLPDDIFADGVAEAVKYGILSSKSLFESFADLSYKEKLESIVYECVGIKADIVNKDEFDNGERKLLNLGHTIGHAIEKCSKYKISHGHAVAIGTAAIARASEKNGICDKETLDKIIEVLRKNNLPTEIPFEDKDITDVALSDKKRAGDTITIVFPREIGNCVMKEINVNELNKLISMGR